MDTYLDASTTGHHQKQSEALAKLLQQTEDSALKDENVNLGTNTFEGHTINSSSTFSFPQKQRIKVAFAEGYMVGNTSEGSQKGGRAMKYLKASPNFVVVVTATF